MCRFEAQAALHAPYNSLSPCYRDGLGGPVCAQLMWEPAGCADFKTDYSDSLYNSQKAGWRLRDPYSRKLIRSGVPCSWACGASNRCFPWTEHGMR